MASASHRLGAGTPIAKSVLLFIVSLVALGLVHLPLSAEGHTWLFTRGRATMQASLTLPFRERGQSAGQVSPAPSVTHQQTIV